MKREGWTDICRALYLAPLLALSGCGASEIASAGSLAVTAFSAFAPRGAAQVAQSIDKRLLIGANSLAETTFLAGTMAFQSGALPVSQDADTARENFCELVTNEPSLAVITDDGGTALALKCRIEHHLDLAGLAEKSNDPVAFAENLAKAGTYNAQLTRMISNAVLKGVSK